MYRAVIYLRDLPFVVSAAVRTEERADELAGILSALPEYTGYELQEYVEGFGWCLPVYR